MKDKVICNGNSNHEKAYIVGNATNEIILNSLIAKVERKDKLKPCPKCNKSWLYVSDGDYYSDYESKGYRVNYSCGYAWKTISWQKTKQEAIEVWNRRVNNG